jgi:hypothetical protein
MTRQIAFSSTRTITLCFSLNDTDRERLLFGWFGRVASVYLLTRKVSATTFSVNLVCNANRTDYKTNPVVVKKDTWYVAAITLTTASQFTKKISGIKFFVQELANLRDGNVLKDTTEQSIQPNAVLMDEIKVNPAFSGNLVIGDMGVKMNVCWLDFFDITLPTSDTRLWKKVGNRDWLGRWYQ